MGERLLQAEEKENTETRGGDDPGVSEGDKEARATLCGQRMVNKVGVIKVQVSEPGSHHVGPCQQKVIHWALTSLAWEAALDSD